MEVRDDHHIDHLRVNTSCGEVVNDQPDRAVGRSVSPGTIASYAHADSGRDWRWERLRVASSFTPHPGMQWTARRVRDGDLSALG